MSRAKALLAVMAGLLSAFLWALPAQAHNSLTGSTPANGARVAKAPEVVTLSFLAKLDPDTTTVTVTGPGNIAASKGKNVVKGNKVSIGVDPGAAGLYTVAYQVGSTDGHPVKGKITFTVTVGVTPGAELTPTPSTPASSTPAPASSAPASVAPSAVALDPVAGGEAGTTWWPWLLGVLVLLIAAATGTYLVRRRTP